MLPKERHIEILRIVNEKGTAKTTELAEKLDCTEETVRRDMDLLAKENKLIRSHGGAMSNKDTLSELKFQTRVRRNTEEKKSIGREAIHTIESGDVIFVDESSTVLALIEELPAEMDIQIVTNSLLVAESMSRKPGIKLILLGGEFNHSTYSFSGLLTDEAAEYIHIDKAFFSCRGFTVDGGAGEPTQERATQKRRLIRRAKWRCALLDATKLGVSPKFYFAKSEEIDLMISNSNLSEKMVEEIANAGIKIILSK